MSRITNWRRESRSPTLAYRNTETGARAVLHRAPDSYRYKWRGAIIADGYPVVAGMRIKFETLSEVIIAYGLTIFIGY